MNQVRFDETFYITEKMRFDLRLHDGKIRILDRVYPHIQGKTVLDFGCGGGNYTKLISQHARHVYGTDNPVALDFATRHNSADSISYGGDYPKTDVTLFFDCLEFVPNWVDVYEKNKSKTNCIICPNFGHRPSLIVKILRKFSFRKRASFQRLREMEKSNYHALYNKGFVRELEDHVRHYEKIPFVRTLYPLHWLFPSHDSFLYVITDEGHAEIH